MKAILLKKRKKKLYITVQLLVLTFCLFSSSSVMSQILAKRIRLSTGDISGLQIITTIKEQVPDVRFTFDEQTNSKLQGHINNSTSSLTLEELLLMIKKKFGINYRNEDEHIIFSLPPTPQKPVQQKGNGAIKGRIVEFESSQPLPGATVYIKELKKTVQSDQQGYYHFTDLPLGTYSLQASFIGFKTEASTVRISATKEETYDIRLQGANVLDEVVITNSRKIRTAVAHTSERQLLSEIKNAQTLTSGISSQEISKSADRNAAEVVKKIAGVTVKDNKFIIIRGMNERYNLTYLNGNIAPSTELYSRAFSLDLIPSRIIDRILVYKSPAPDLMADMTGGAVKIYTKDARNIKHFDLELQLGVRPNTAFSSQFLTYQGSGTDFLGFDNGLRKLPSVVPGYGDFTKATLDQKSYVENFSPYLQYGYKLMLPMMQLTANYYDSFKLGSKRVSMLSSLSYKSEGQQYMVNRANSFYGGDLDRTHVITQENQSTEMAQLNLLQNFTYVIKDSSTLMFKNYFLQQGQSGTVVRTSKNDQYLVNEQSNDLAYLTGLTWRDRSPGFDLQERNIILSYTQRSLYSGNFSGDHYLEKGRQRLEWNLGYTYSIQQIPDQRVIRFQRNRQDGARVILPGPENLNWTAAYRYVPGPDDIENKDNSLDRGMLSRSWSQNTENVYNGSVDYTYKLQPWITLKAGTYQQWKSRKLFRRVYTLNEGDLNSAGYPGSPAIGGNGNFMDFSKVFFQEQDLGKVWSADYLRDDGSALKIFDRTSGSDAYIATEQLNAGYAAISLLPFHQKLDIYGGLRVEHNRQKVAGAIPPEHVGDVNKPVLVDNKKTNYLPSLNIGYRPTEQTVLRLAYGQTVNRPEFRELSPYSELDYLNNQTIKGNNLLRPAEVKNYDMRIEWYPKDNKNAEVLSVGAFHKKLKSPIERMIYRSLYFGGPATVSFGNADQATVNGIELEIRKNLGFVPSRFFRNLSVSANFTWIKSEVKKSIDTTLNKNVNPGLNPYYTRQLQGQSPYIINAGLYYDNAGSGTKIALNWNLTGPNIYAAANGSAFNIDRQGTVPIINQGEQGSLIELKRQLLDFALTQRLLKSLQFKLSVQNILNQPIRIAEDENFTYKYEKAVYQGKDNVDISGDMISSQYKTDRHIICSFMYSF